MKFKDTKFWKTYPMYDRIVNDSSMRSTVDSIILWKLLQQYQFKNFLEIGVYQGLTTGLMFESTPDAIITGIDVSNRLSLFYKNYSEYTNQFTFFNQPSQSFDFNNSMYDFILIDGNHRYQEAKTDIFNCLPCLNSAGILAIDDYKMEGVANAIQDLYNLKTDWVPFLRSEQIEYWHHRGHHRDDFLDSLFNDPISKFIFIRNETDNNKNKICVAKTVAMLTDQTEYFNMALTHYNI
tara:strand:+ start:76 stop:786 length:711 start_codon:yes stop_codon:yes gene_type:complete